MLLLFNLICHVFIFYIVFYFISFCLVEIFTQKKEIYSSVYSENCINKPFKKIRHHIFYYMIFSQEKRKKEKVQYVTVKMYTKIKVIDAPFDKLLYNRQKCALCSEPKKKKRKRKKGGG